MGPGNLAASDLELATSVVLADIPDSSGLVGTQNPTFG